MSGSGVSRFARVTSKLSSGPRRPLMSDASVVPSDTSGASQVDSSESASSSCRYSTGPSGDRCSGGTQLTSEPSGLIGVGEPGPGGGNAVLVPASAKIWLA